jgi:hypothetical protein
MTVTVDIGAAIFGIGMLLIAILVIAVVVMLWRKIRGYFAGRAYDAADRGAFRARWAEIEAMVRAEGQMTAKVAIIEADKLLDHALKALAMPGTTLGERLKFAQYKYPELRKVWWAHKVRNQLAHEASYRLEPGIARKAVAEFRRALERLGAI